MVLAGMAYLLETLYLEYLQVLMPLKLGQLYPRKLSTLRSPRRIARKIDSKYSHSSVCYLIVFCEFGIHDFIFINRWWIFPFTWNFTC